MSALLEHFKGRVRPFKIGPDFIDPQFHQKVSLNSSINLDTYMMNEDQVRWLFHTYADKELSILEGVMGFYDGMDKGCSAYDVSKLLQVPTLMILDASATYITLSAILHGLRTYKDDNTIQAVVLNRISSKRHYELIKKQLHLDHPSIMIVGWIANHLEALKEIHLGLDLSEENFQKLPALADAVLEHIDTNAIYQLASSHVAVENYPFKSVPKSEKTLGIVHDKNFSFLYHDNLMFCKELFREVIMIDSTKDEDFEVDSLYIPGGYVETPKAYQALQKAKKFKSSLITHANSKPIYAECAGFLYLGNRVDDKEMSGVLDIDFTMQQRFTRLGYYEIEGIKGHCFHYSKPSKEDIMMKQEGKIYGTYLHTFFRNHIDLVERYLLS